jgi:hypothetical protein
MKKIKGQSLTEILIALAIGVAFINVGILAMSTANILAKVNKANNFALSLLKSQRSAIETITENGWHSIADLTIGKHYKLAKQNNSWTIQQGEEKVFDEKPPVAQWNFDEGSGTTAYDNVGTNSGALTNSPTWQTSPSNCVSGNCLNFDGSSSYVSAGNSTIFNFSKSNPFTINTWIKHTSSVSENHIVSRHSLGTNGGYLMLLLDSGGATQTLYLDIINSTANQYAVTYAMDYRDQWHNVVGVYDGSGNRSGMKLYVDGINVATGTSTTIANEITLADSPLVFGKAAYSNGFYYKGLIDDVRIYDYALTENQVKQHYNAGLNRLGLVSQWGMDEGSGLTVYDSQSTNNGTLTCAGTGCSNPVWQTSSSCVSGNCLSFTGTTGTAGPGSYTSVANSNSVTYATLEAWVYPTQVSNDQMFLTNASDNANYLRIVSNKSFVSFNISGTQKTLAGTTILSNNKWYHLVATYDGSIVKLYVNGIQETNTLAQTGTLTFPSGTINIGIWATSDVRSFIGYLDDVRVYNRALSTDEIANQYKDGYTKYFYVNNVSRDIASDPTASTHNLETTYNANHDDPNTKKITNVTRYLLGTPGRVNTQEQYLSRATNINSLIQTDWSGSGGITGPEIDFGNNYSTVSNLTLSTAGQMSLTSTASNGTLTSTIIDTQSINGSGYFNILWQGDSLCSGCSVKFQIAASNCSNGASNYPTCNTGTWTYYGPTTTSDYYIPSGPGIPVPITYAGQYSALSASVQNKRYVRYQITLVPASSLSPVVKDVIINYAP